MPVGTGQEIISIRDSYGISDDQVAIVSNPEFLREGTAIYDFFHPDRIVIGSSNEKALDVAQELYSPLYRSETPIVRTSLQTSELSKYASNAFLATKISFINEIANLCEKTGIDVKDISFGMGSDQRIGDRFLRAGPAYGGSCFPKDTRALVNIGKKFNTNLSIVKSVILSNENRRLLSNKKLIQIVNNDFSNKIITFLGVTFKPNTDDMREASSISMIKYLNKKLV